VTRRQDLSRLLAAILVVLGFALPVRADEVALRRVVVEPVDNAYALTADFEFVLTGRLEEALQHGVTLTFEIEFQCIRPRWYWFDERVSTHQLAYRLVFHALTRQYRVSSGALYQNFESLNDAMAAIGRVRAWPVLERDRFKPGSACDAGLRLHLDIARLPKPFQVRAITDRDWIVDSDWTRWRLTAPTPERKTR